MIKKQTLYMAILVSLTVGFLGGTIYSSFKLMGEVQPEKSDLITMNETMPSDIDSVASETKLKIKEFEKHLEHNASDVKSWIALGNLYFDSDQPDQAIHAYEKALVFDPANPAVFTDLGVMYRRNGDSKKALEAFDKAISLDPEFEIAFFNKGILLMHDLNQMEQGISSWEDLLKINPEATVPGGGLIKDFVEKIKSK